MVLVTNNNIFVSQDYCNTWAKKVIDTNFIYKYNILQFPNKLFISAKNANYSSYDYGLTWEIDTVFANHRIKQVDAYKNYVAYTTYDSLYVSIDSGKTFNNKSVPTSAVKSIAYIDSSLYFVFDYLYVSMDNGNTWATIKSGYKERFADFKNLIMYNNKLLIYINEFGMHTLKNDSIVHFALHTSKINDIEIVQNSIYCVTEKNGIVYFDENNNKWLNIGFNPIHSNNLVYSNKKLFIGSNYGIFESDDYGKSWEYCFLGGSKTFLKEIQDSLYAFNDSDNISLDPVFRPFGVFKYNNNGKWEQKRQISYVYYINTNKNDRIFYFLRPYIYDLKFPEFKRNNVDFPGSYLEHFYANENIYIVSCYDYSEINLYISYDFGETWKNSFSKISQTLAIRDFNNVLYLSIEFQNIDTINYSSIDMGNTWFEVDKIPYIPQIANYRDDIKFDLINDKMAISIDDGNNWYKLNTGLNKTIKRIVTVDDWLIVENNDGLFRTKISSFLSSSVKSKDFVLSKPFSISPNPAKDQITVTFDTDFSFPDQNLIMIYNSLGEKISEHKIDKHNEIIDVHNLSNGVYFIRIGNITEKFIKN